MPPKNSLNSQPEDFTIKLADGLPPRWQKFEEEIKGIVFDQERPIRKVTRTLMALEAGLHDPRRPPDPFIFAGPPGSGKTYLAEIIAKVWLGEPKREGEIGPLIVLSGENFGREHEGSTLKGAPPSYIGFGQKTPLEDTGVFDKMRRLEKLWEIAFDWEYEMEKKGFRSLSPSARDEFFERAKRMMYKKAKSMGPYRSVLLVDEFEKMHISVQKQFLGILSSGGLKLHSGKFVDFRGTLIIFTTNIGSEEINKLLENRGIGFVSTTLSGKSQDQINQRIYKTTRSRIEKDIDPALFSRIGHDGIVVFHALPRETLSKILDYEITRVQAKLLSEDLGPVRIYVSEEAKELILNGADTPREGARQIGRLVTKYISDPLARVIESDELRGGDEVLIAVEGSKIQLRRLPRPTSPKLPPLRRPARTGDMDTLEKEMFDDLTKEFKNLLKEKYPIVAPEEED
ncbi:MAG: AAA family ATPase [Candidatus Spechtbacterales bacterium]